MDTGDDVQGHLLALSLDRFDLSTRTANCLQLAEVYTVEALIVSTAKDVLAWQNAGKKTLDEIRRLLGRIGLKLAGDPFPVGVIDRKLLAELAIDPAEISVSATGIASPSGEVHSTEPSGALYLNKAPLELQRSLVLAPKSLSLSVRAQAAIKTAGALFLGELAQLTFDDIVKYKNAGRSTAKEIADALKEFGLKFGMMIPDWSRNAALALRGQLEAEIAEDRKQRDKRLLASVAAEPTKLEAELLRIARALEDERNAAIVVSLWGWSGAGPRTLESVGKELGITRERVRQIEARALRRLTKHSFEAPLVKATIALLRREAPDLDSVLAEKIREHELSREAFNPRGLQIAAEYLGTKWPFSIVALGQQRILALADEAEKLRRAPLALRKKSSERGCTSVLALAAELKIAEDRIPGLVRVLESTCPVQWLDTEHEWLFWPETARNRLHNLCSKVLGVCDNIRVSELRRAVSKSRRLAMCPPQRILANFIEQSGLGRVEESVIYAKPGASSAPADESAEGRMIRVLDTYGPIMDGEAFAEKCIAAGMNATTFYIYRIISPVICSLGRNVYCKVGTNVPPGVIEDIVSQRRSTPIVSDHGWTSDGKLWFGTELTRQVIVAGSIRLAPFVRDLVQGEWRVTLPDGTEFGTVVCRDTFIWSFRKAFALLGAEPADLAALEFDLKAKTVLARIGGPGLFESLQDPESASADDGLDGSYPSIESMEGVTS
jgi:hypothetical protein